MSNKTLEEEVKEERKEVGFYESPYQQEDWAAVVVSLCRVLDRRLSNRDAEKGCSEPEENPMPDLRAESPLVDVNNCNETDLVKLGLTPLLAARVVERRPYSAPWQLLRVKGLGRKRYALLEDKICCGGSK